MVAELFVDDSGMDMALIQAALPQLGVNFVYAELPTNLPSGNRAHGLG